jgi:hypothetical protein
MSGGVTVAAVAVPANALDRVNSAMQDPRTAAARMGRLPTPRPTLGCIRTLDRYRDLRLFSFPRRLNRSVP